MHRRTSLAPRCQLVVIPLSAVAAVFTSCSRPHAFDPRNYPSAMRGDTVDVLHGVEVPDPYRWLEEEESNATQAWMDRQNELTHRTLAPFANVQQETARELEHLQPFGQGNEQPLLRISRIPLRQYETMGADRSHLRLVLSTKQGMVRAPFFGAASRSRELVGVRAVDLVVTMSVGFWNGPRLELQVQDMRPASAG